ncbi:OmpA family protein [Vibrio panuliri]|uniref:OmpA-like domain-containing protein n=1 Tax=Vibrio panuliri TaxID=1381081 RepID=A0ABX3FEK3_9VIBR|nr:OmpA family protein [Vibrio panuliri]KAB1454444.1 OmpA family protein [Vibrio panuliri]OLQ89984.1 hypothetical protein BIY20_10795 [Vibrio panuliri]
MINKVIPFAACAALLSGCVAGDKQYDYIATPTPNQVADLIDDDNDGVINARDLCTSTPTGAKIDNVGCGEIEKSSESLKLHILFANDSSEIMPIFDTQIEQMAAFLTQYPETEIEIQGYASKVGSEEYNLALSERRALTVEKALESYDINPDRVRVVGFGETKLEDQGEDEISHARNRKVVANVVGYKGNVVEEWTIFTRLPK